LGELAYEWDDLEGALAYTQQSIELSRQWGNSDTLCNGLLTLAQVQMAWGDLEAASAALREAKDLSTDLAMTPLFAMQLDTRRVRLWLVQGSVDAARRWAEESALAPVNPVYPPETLALARVQLAMGRPQEARDTLREVLRIARNQGLAAVIVETLVLQALVYLAEGSREQALLPLTEALALAEEEQFVRTFVDEGENLASLLTELSRKSPAVAPDYVSELVGAFERDRARRRGSQSLAEPSPGQPPSVLVEPLSERELEILQLVSTGLSNQEIADACFIAVSTVKSHLNNAFGKLNVKNRIQAVARAKGLGLL
jgi:LuxR family maltose regulon positive regulatory protein